jgi:excisionase family DNA binding protein
MLRISGDDLFCTPIHTRNQKQMTEVNSTSEVVSTTALPKLFYTRQEVAQILSMSVRSIDSMIALKELPVRRFGKSVRIPAESLRAFAKRDHQTGRKVKQVVQ